MFILEIQSRFNPENIQTIYFNQLGEVKNQHFNTYGQTRIKIVNGQSWVGERKGGGG